MSRRRTLLAEIRATGGKWTTGMVVRFYRSNGVAPCRKTARDDLALMARRGLLRRHGATNNLHYTLNAAGGGR